MAVLVTTTPKLMLALPNTDVGRLVQIATQYSRNDAPVELVSFNSDHNVLFSAGEENVGVVLVEPALRLYRAFEAQKHLDNAEKDFVRFYSNPIRINLYSRAFKNLDKSALGYIGIGEYFYKSLMLTEDWLNTNYYRIPYWELSQTSPFEISQAHMQDIQLLHANDYSLYEELKAEFECRWEKYLLNKQIEIAKSKQVYIHLGPPKTGTSAIQSWLKSSKQALAALGIHYPSHKEDKNGVSSGNFEHLVSFNKDNQGYFDDLKASDLGKYFNNHQCNTLLLSSEHFFYYLLWLFTRFPSATYLFYIRHPVAALESSFHQEVKRHRRIEAFSFPKQLGFNNLAIVSRLAKEFNINVNFRFYSEALFNGGSLLSDFATAFPRFLAPPLTSKRLNTQYSPGALMLMRLCNEFASDWLLRDLDFWLQKDSECIDNFSLISPALLEQADAQLSQALKQIAVSDKYIDSGKLKALIEGYKIPAFCNESDMMCDFERVLKKLRDEKPALAGEIVTQCEGARPEVSTMIVPNLTLSKYYKSKIMLTNKLALLRKSAIKYFRTFK